MADFEDKRNSQSATHWTEPGKISDVSNPSL